MLFRLAVLTRRTIKLAIIALLFLSSTPPVPLAHAGPVTQEDLVSDLWLDISLGPPLIDWFNQVARPNDIARIERIQQISLLDEITTGRKLVVFKSIEDAEQVLPHIADKIDIVGYNLENGQYNRPLEKANPVDSVKRMQELASEYDLLLAFGPDHELAISDGVAVAPYVDIFVLQVQRVQTEPAKVSSFVWPLIPQLRRANPDIEISVQVRTEGDVTEITALIDALSDQLDGVSILTSPETVETAEALVFQLQTSEDTIAGPLEDTRVRPAVRLTPTPVAAVQTVKPGQVSAEPEAAGLSCPLMVVGAFIAGGIGGGVTAALICARKGADRTANGRL
jgi:hypothetical protein